MHVYILKEKNVGARPGYILAVYVVNDDNPPPDVLKTKLAAHGYELSRHIPDSPTKGTWVEMVRDEVRLNHDMDAGGAEWPEKG
jgi:hypothetical protein